MRKVFVYMLAFVMLFLTRTAVAQHSIVYSQYIFNGLLINPAYAGSYSQFSSSLSYRNQWINFDGAPETTTLAVHSTLKNDKIGTGLLITNDKIGSYRNTGLFGSYAYMIKMPRRAVLSLGVQAGCNIFKANFSDLNKKVDADPVFGTYLSEARPNFGGGIFYTNQKVFAGFSVPTILKHANYFKQFEQLSVPRFYYLHAGTTMPLDRMGRVKVVPSILVRAQDGTPLSLDLNLNLVFHDVISLGNSYRTGDAVVTFTSFRLSEKFQFVYSYDWTTSALGAYSKGTHEVAISYRTRIRTIHKDVECPYFFY